MAGNGPPPKPDSQRRRRNASTFEWVTLPAEGRAGDAPPLPSWRRWKAATKTWWSNLWSKPQATQWEPDGSTLWTLAVLYDDMIRGERPSNTLAAEMRQHEDRHGLSPKAMLGLRWRFAGADEELTDLEVEGADQVEGAAPLPSSDRRQRLRVVG